MVITYGTFLLRGLHQLSLNGRHDFDGLEIRLW